MILVYGGLYPSKQPCLPLPTIVCVNWRSQSTSWVLSVFACHLVRCGGAKEKRNESSTAHITGGSLGLSASVSRIWKRGKEKQQRTKKEGSPICFYRRPYTICFYPNFRQHWFPRNWIRGALFSHFTFSSICLKHRYWNPSSAALFPAHLEGIQQCRKLRTMFPMLPFFAFPIWSIPSIQHDRYFELVFHSSLQDLPLHPSSCPWGY